MADRIKLGGLWLNRTRDGREYLTGKLSPTVRILIFQNDFKTNENSPTHVMYLAPVETEEAQPRQPAPDSFFGGARTGGGAGAGTTSDEGFDTGDFDDAFSAPEEDFPAAPPPSRPAPAAAARPQATAPPPRVPPASGASRPAGARQAASEPPPRRTNPAPPARRAEPVTDDSEDPFSE
jgi:hypothetical protein